MHPTQMGKARATKPKKCAMCSQMYTPRPGAQAFERWCSLSCGVELGRERMEAARAKRQAKELRERKVALTPRSKVLAAAQQAFNGYIRERDRGLPCISSGVMEQERFTGGHFDAGHYRSTGAAPHLRFNTYNCHAQAKRENRDLSGNIVAYRKGLIDRIGLEKVERLENDNAIRSFDIVYLRRVRSIFTRRAKQLAKRRGA